MLKTIASSKQLIIIDNFNVNEDENLELLFQCPFKFMITTREDFRDYNYQQILVDKIKDQNEILKLFSTYNQIEYSDDEMNVIKKLIEFVDNHTMTVELISKYLRNTGRPPLELYHYFLEQEEITNVSSFLAFSRKR